MDFSKEYEWGNKLRPLVGENVRSHEFMDVSMFFEGTGMASQPGDKSATAKWLKGFNRSLPGQRKGWYHAADLEIKRDVAAELQPLGDYRAIGMDEERRKVFEELEKKGWYDSRLESHPTFRLKKMDKRRDIEEAIVESGFDAVVRGMMKEPFMFGVRHDEFYDEHEYDPDEPIIKSRKRMREEMSDEYVVNAMLSMGEEDEPFPNRPRLYDAAFKHDLNEKVDYSVDKAVDKMIEDIVRDAVGLKSKELGPKYKRILDDMHTKYTPELWERASMSFEDKYEY